MSFKWSQFDFKFLRWLLAACMLGVALFLINSWFAEVKTLNFDSDEVVWVLDAQFYEARRQKNWEKFQLSKTDLFRSWAHEKHRLLDQPQLGKYIFGWWLQRQDFRPWVQEEPSKPSLYQAFAQIKLPQGKLQDLDSQLGQSVVASILSSRNLMAFWALAAFIGFSLLNWSLTKSWLLVAGAYFLIFFHPTLRYWYRVAVPNAVQINFILLASGLMLYFLNRRLKKRWQQIAGWLLVGVTIALSSAIKLNGLFLLFFPGFSWMLESIWVWFTANSLKILRKWKQSLLINLSLATGFMISFIYLEPEIWFQPWVGARSLLLERWRQQQAFRRVFEDYSFLETLFFLVNEFLRVMPNIYLKISLFGCLFFGGYRLWLEAKRSKKWRVILYFFVFIILTTAFYADVGFERYAEWSLYVFSFVASFGGIELLLSLQRLLVRQSKGWLK